MKLEELREIVKENPFSKYIGMELVDVREGYAFGRINFEKQHENIYGGMHGGCAYSLADTVAGIAASTYGEYVTTVAASMNYLLPVEKTNYVNCTARTLRHGRKVSVIRIEITNDDGTLLIDGSFTFYNFKKKKFS
ncbi:MAG: PaaI family thioesterase [Suilimivivens sp.]